PPSRCRRGQMCANQRGHWLSNPRLPQIITAPCGPPAAGLIIAAAKRPTKLEEELCAGSSWLSWSHRAFWPSPHHSLTTASLWPKLLDRLLSSSRRSHAIFRFVPFLSRSLR